MKAWYNYANKIYSSLGVKCYDYIEDYDFEKEVLPVIENALSKKEKMNVDRESFEKISESINEKIINEFGVEIENKSVVLLGI